MAPAPSKTLTNEERIKRILEAKKKYSDISKAKTRVTAKKDEQRSGSSIPNRTTNIPRPSVASKPQARSSTTTNADRKLLPAAPARRAASQSNRPAPIQEDDDEFQADAGSLAMLKSNKPIPQRVFSRTTLGRPSVVDQRCSLLPMGINIFTATREQKELLRDKFGGQNARESISAPQSASRTRPSTTGRARVIRFEQTIEEQRESVESTSYALRSSVERKHPAPELVEPPKSILRNAHTTATPASRRCPRTVIPSKSRLLENVSNTLDEFSRHKDATSAEDVDVLKNLAKKIEELIEASRPQPEVVANDENAAANVTVEDSSGALPPLQGSVSRTYKPMPLSMFRDVAIEEDDEEEDSDENERVVVKPRRQSRRLSRTMPSIIEPRKARRSSRIFKK